MSTTPAEESRLGFNAGVGALPVGAAGTTPIVQTYDRRLAISAAFAPTTATLTMTGIYLPAGQIVNGITFVSGATAESGGSHLWYALYNSSLILLAQATDNTGAAAFGANTAFRMALTTPQTCPTAGLYYLGFCCVGTIPTLLNITSGVTNNLGSITGMTPILSGTSTGSLVGVAPSTAAALTTIAQCLYAFID